jgi:hypothetical protein
MSRQAIKAPNASTGPQEPQRGGKIPAQGKRSAALGPRRDTPSHPVGVQGSWHGTPPFRRIEAEGGGDEEGGDPGLRDEEKRRRRTTRERRKNTLEDNRLRENQAKPVILQQIRFTIIQLQVNLDNKFVLQQSCFQMKDLPPDFYTGAPVDPADLWFRDEFISDLWEIIEGHHSLLRAPRRTGKTSVMDYLAARPEQGFAPVTVYVQDLDHPGEFILTLLDAFHERHPSFFRAAFEKGSRVIGNVLSRVGEIGVEGFKVALRNADPDWRTNWRHHGDEFFKLVRDKNERLLIIVDEFPDMIINMKKNHPELVRPFLAWFRGHRTNPAPKKDPIRWLLGGSVNLSSTLDAIGCIDEINDLHEEPLPVLTAEQVAVFVNTMLRSRTVEISEDLPPAVADRLGRPVPLFLQMITQDLYRIWKRERRKLEVADVDKAFDDLVVSSAARDKLQHYYSRIAQYYDEPKRSAAYELLATLSVIPDGMERDRLASVFQRVLADQGITLPDHERKRLFNEILRDLENDFYVAEVATDRFDFSSGLLKSWWKKYYA